MKNIKNKMITALILVMMLASGMVAFADKYQVADTKTPATPKSVQLDVNKKTTATNPIINETAYVFVKSLDVVANPNKYLNKQVKFRAVFDKFSTLGLDYKPAFRDSQKYITFLIKRDDVTDHTIPLSEMKIFIKRSEAEKFIELDSGDIIEVYGKVFSTALTDAWVEVDKLVVITKKNKEEKKA